MFAMPQRRPGPEESTRRPGLGPVDSTGLGPKQMAADVTRGPMCVCAARECPAAARGTLDAVRLRRQTSDQGYFMLGSRGLLHAGRRETATICRLRKPEAICRLREMEIVCRLRETANMPSTASNVRPARCGPRGMERQI